jgi:YfiR/HmsC-like
VALLSLCLLSPAVSTADPQPDQEVKAAYLARLAPFVVWPTSLFAGPGVPLTLCIQGGDPFGPMLDRMTAGQGVGSHPIIVRRIERLDADSGCQIAYVGGSPAQSLAAALKAVDGKPVLTVTDGDGEGGGKGIVHFVVISGRVRFEIDAGRADQCGLSISSKLLALASDVKR